MSLIVLCLIIEYPLPPGPPGFMTSAPWYCARVPVAGSLMTRILNVPCVLVVR